MNKLKPLKPSLREKKRYLMFEVISKDKLKKNFFSELVDRLKSTLGLFDAASAGIMLIKTKKQRGMIKVSHKYINKVKVALMLSGMEDDYTIQTLGISGIMKKAEKRYMAG